MGSSDSSGLRLVASEDLALEELLVAEAGGLPLRGLDLVVGVQHPERTQRPPTGRALVRHRGARKGKRRQFHPFQELERRSGPQRLASWFARWRAEAVGLP